MHALPALVSLLSLSLTATLAAAVAVPVDPPAVPATRKSCVVPLVIMNGLGNPFHITLESTDHRVDGRNISFVRQGNTLQPGLYNRPGRLDEPTRLHDGKLSLPGSGPPVAFIVEPRGRPRFRRVAFASPPPTSAATYEAFFKCSPSTNHAETVVRPAGDDASLCNPLLPPPPPRSPLPIFPLLLLPCIPWFPMRGWAV